MTTSQSDFERSLKLNPLSDDLAARVERAEEIIGLLLQALLGGEQPGGRGVARAVTRVGEASEVLEHLPAPEVLSRLLDKYRSAPATINPLSNRND